jgi:hypothetical protein
VSAETALRLALVPAAVWLASLAARRWGHGVSGYLGGLPLIGGPITLFLALDLGPEFAARSALFTLAAVLGQAAHLTAFAYAARRHAWPIALAAGWAGFFLVSLLAAGLPMFPLAALAMAVAGLAVAWRLLPAVRGNAVPPAIPPVELRLRLAAAFVLAGLILWAAPVFGPVVSGVLLSMPVTGSIMPPFTLALYGAGSLARLLRGFVVGLSGFTTFFFVVASTLVAWGVVASFCVALCGALAAVFAVSRLLNPPRS